MSDEPGNPEEDAPADSAPIDYLVSSLKEILERCPPEQIAEAEGRLRHELRSLDPSSVPLVELATIPNLQSILADAFSSRLR